MRIKKGFKLKNVSGQQTVVADRRIIKNYNNVIVLNETAVFLWELISERNVTKQEMLELLLEKFDISTVLALGNIDVFVKTLKENEIIEE